MQSEQIHKITCAFESENIARSRWTHIPPFHEICWEKVRGVRSSLKGNLVIIEPEDGKKNLIELLGRKRFGEILCYDELEKPDSITFN